MNLFQLALRNISRNAFRSWTIFLCAFYISGFALAMMLIVHGAEQSLDLANQRLGADILVVPNGSEQKVETSLLMGNPTNVWMPREVVEKIARLPEVESISPQLYLATLTNAACCSVSNMFVIAFDPQTDFTITPWLEQRLGRALNPGEAIGGMYVFTPPGEEGIKIYGTFVRLMGNLEPTGTGLDRALFISFDTAYDIARNSRTRAVEPLQIPDNSISAALIRVRRGNAAQIVSMKIEQQIPEVTAIDSPELFLSYRNQINGLAEIVWMVLAIALVLSIAIVDLIFTMAVNARRREIAVLRALGSTRRSIFFSLLAEANLLAFGGGMAGLALSALAVYLFRNLLVSSLQMPFLLPSLPELVFVLAIGILVVLAAVSISVLPPALAASRREPALAMRE
ncbi:MAG: FtsX-like permease family protein [Chloroflexi bacterium]|nr:FtsX-like permease family protein [Chloroflexota bacterium]